MYYTRLAENLVEEYLHSFRVIGIMGPRQSGKSTMIKHLLQNSYEYISFDYLEYRDLLKNDPALFIKRYNRHVVFDEVQLVPELFQWIKITVDENPDDKGRFVLTGSGQFLLSKNISESLAGRIGLIALLPFQYSETPVKYRENNIIKGGYPEIVTGNIKNPLTYFDSYINTYLQKDLRTMINISDLHTFTQLIKLLAARVTQTLNLSTLAKEIGITVSTVSKWISVLEASYIIFLLNPYHNNLGKRLIKSPKVYFYDNGLLAFLTGIHNIEQIESGIFSGPVFENFIVSEVKKIIHHSKIFADLYFIRTSHGDEIDLVIETGEKTHLVEIKSSVTYKPHFHAAINKLTRDEWKRHVVYKGKSREILQSLNAWNYNDFLLHWPF